MATFYRRGGKKNKGATWYVQYFDEDGRRRTVRGCADRDATEALARKLEADVMLRRKGVIDAKADRYSQEGRKPIAQHLEAFGQDMLSRGVAREYAKKVGFRVAKVFGLAGVSCLRDITPSAVQEAVGRIRDEGRSPKTCNDTLAAVKQFCSWARRDGRLAENPIDHLRGFNTAVDRRHDRRPLSDDELRRLLKATASGSTLQKCPGPERALIYKFSALTGLRKNEIATLKKGSFDLDGRPATVTVEAAFSKHRREDTLPLPDELVQDLREHLRDRTDNEPAFRVPLFAYRALKRDLEAAGIEYRDGSGRVADFHSLRHSFVTRLVKAGVNTKTAQLLARHSDPRLTLGVYSHIEIIDQAAAIDALPPLEKGDVDLHRQKMRATGTDSAHTPVQSVGTYVGSCAALSDTECHSETYSNIKSGEKKPFGVTSIGDAGHRLATSGILGKTVELRGIEPLTS